MPEADENDLPGARWDVHVDYLKESFGKNEQDTRDVVIPSASRTLPSIS